MCIRDRVYAYESEFDLDLDGDSIIGTPLTPINADLYLQNDLYALKGSTDTDAVLLSNSSGTTYNDATAAGWDAVSAIKQTDGTFRVLLDGANNRENQALVWTTNAQGVITSSNGGWKSGAEVYAYESEFDLDLDGCLLYTSPSPRDRTRSRMPSSA